MKISKAILDDLMRQLRWMAWFLASLKASQVKETAPRATPLPKVNDFSILLADTPIQSNAPERVYDAAKAVIGYDLSKIAEDERGCAESLSRVLRKVYPDFPIFVRTTELNTYLKTSSHFKAVLHPTVGCVTIFPTAGAKIGHCGVWGKEWVMSNSSDVGRWEANYRLKEWEAEANRRYLPLFHYLPI